jgi:hypothetical protein
MNLMVTLLRVAASTENSSMIISPTYTEDVRGVERIEWTPQHVVFHFGPEKLYVCRADRVLDMTSYED